MLNHGDEEKILTSKYLGLQSYRTSPYTAFSNFFLILEGVITGDHAGQGIASTALSPYLQWMPTMIKILETSKNGVVKQAVHKKKRKTKIYCAVYR